MASPYDEFAKPADSVKPPPADPYAEFAGGAPPPGLTPGSANSGAAEKFATNFATAINPLPALKAFAAHPLDTAQSALNAQMGQFTRAKQAFRGEGEFSGMTPTERGMSALGHGVAGLVPLAGPAAADAGDQIGSGDVAGGLGSGAGQIFNVSGAPRLTSLAGTALRAGADPLMETGLGIRNVDRTNSKAPGRAALDYTSGVRMPSIAKSAQDAMSREAVRRDAFINNSTTQASLKPGRDTLSDSIARAAAGNSDTSHLAPMMEQLTAPKPGFSGATQPSPTGTLTISEMQDPSTLLKMRQRFGNDFTKFDHARPLSSEALSVGNKTYKSLTDELHRAVPESAPSDRIISNLMPVKDGAEARALNAGMAQRSLGRIMAHTSALTGAVLGYQHGGLPGLIGGIVGPEIIGNPEVQAAAARAANSVGNTLKRPGVGKAVGAFAAAAKRNQ